MNKKKHLKLRITIGFLFLYIASYVIFSCFGGYIPTQSGEIRYKNIGLSVTDVHLWKPKFVFGQLFRTIGGKLTYRGNILGYIYAPLVIIDHKCFHKTKRIFEL